MIECKVSELTATWLTVSDGIPRCVPFREIIVKCSILACESVSLMILNAGSSVGWISVVKVSVLILVLWKCATSLQKLK